MAVPVQFCSFHVGDLFLGVELLRVQEVNRLQDVTVVPLAPHVVSGLINLRGQIITAIDLRTRLGLPPMEEDKTPTCIVIRTDRESVCLLVDRIGDVLSPPAETFEEAPENLSGPIRDAIHGVCKLDDEILLILKTEVVVEKAAA